MIRPTIVLALATLLLACNPSKPKPLDAGSRTDATAPARSCLAAKNTCTDYSASWHTTCPTGARCIEFKNSCAYTVALAYNIGCDGDGKPGAPQCACTPGPKVVAGASSYWQIVDGNYTSCLPSWKPPCLTASLAVLANKTTSACDKGTRFEFAAGNTADPYGRFDSYNLDIEKTWYAMPVEVRPTLTCAVDHANHDCRPLYCGAASCPDAYATPTTGGCSDGRSPQVSCQDMFSKKVGLTVEYCPAACNDGCPSCQDAKSC